MNIILSKIASHKFNKNVWIGKDYSVQDLINALALLIHESLHTKYLETKSGTDTLFTTA